MSKGEWVDPNKKSKKKIIPIIPALPEGEPDFDPNPVVARCGECGIELRQVMHFVCNNNRCPMQPRIIC